MLIGSSAIGWATAWLLARYLIWLPVDNLVVLLFWAVAGAAGGLVSSLIQVLLVRDIHLEFRWIVSLVLGWSIGWFIANLTILVGVIFWSLAGMFSGGGPGIRQGLLPFAVIGGAAGGMIVGSMSLVAKDALKDRPWVKLLASSASWATGWAILVALRSDSLILEPPIWTQFVVREIALHGLVAGAIAGIVFVLLLSLSSVPRTIRQDPN